MSRFARAVSFLMLLTAGWAGAQSFDSSGNNLLNGTYYFRHVTYQVTDAVGDIGYAAVVYGTISFHGDGTYTMNTPWFVDSGGNNQAVNSVNGNYTVSASGYGFLDNPLIGDTIYGLVSNGIFVGSSTESGYNDLFIAVTTSSAVTSTTLSGTYSIAYMNILDGTPGNNYDAVGTLTPDARGGIAPVSLTGYFGSSGSSPFTVTESGVRSTFSNGAYNLSFPIGSQFPIRGTQFLYISPDGNFVFGGSNGNINNPSAPFDFFVGVRKGSAASLGGTSQNGVCSPQCLYYQAGLSEDASQLPSFATIGSFFGSFYANGGNIVGHQRFEFNSSTQINTEDFTYTDTYPTNATGQYTSHSTQYVFSQDGGVRIGFGVGPFLGIDVSLRAPTFSGAGVFLDPTGIQNAASFAPFTASLAPGELLLLTGSGLADQLVVADINKPFPNTLGGVQVLINSVPAPIYYVTPNFIAVLVPYATSGIAQIQVVNNRGSSNTVSDYVGTTAPGVYTANGYAIAQHTDYSLVTPDNPAHSGDTLLVYMTGLGAVSPAIADGAIGPTSPVSTTTNTFTATIGGVPATVVITEVVPTIAGDYVLAVTVPSGVAPGSAVLAIAGPDSITTAAVLPVSN